MSLLSTLSNLSLLVLPAVPLLRLLSGALPGALPTYWPDLLCQTVLYASDDAAAASGPSRAGPTASIGRHQVPRGGGVGTTASGAAR